VIRACVAAVTAVGLAAPVGALAGTGVSAGTGTSSTYQGTSLAGTTTIHAARSARTVVDLPRPVTLHTALGDGHADGIRVTGPGRMLGFALVSADGDLGFLQVAFRSCFSAGCHREMPGQSLEQIGAGWGGPPPPYGTSKPPTTFHLPAGEYVLSVLADGAPVRVTLRLPELTGHAALDLRLPRHSQTLSPTEHSVSSAGIPTNSQAWGTGTVGTDAVLLAYEHISQSKPHASNDVSWCIYDNSGPPAGTLAPDCPGGDGSTFTATFVSVAFASTSYGLAITTGPAAAGRYYQGIDDTGAQALTEVHDNLMWADLGAVTQSG
jgi:hypothetical protein